MTHLIINMSSKFERDLLKFMRIRHFSTKTEAIKKAKV